MSIPDLVVIGGGVAGLTSALAATRRGLRVTLVDQPRAGAASRASAGMLAPSIGSSPPEILALAIEARDFYSGFLAQLFDHSGISVPLDRDGVLELAPSAESLEEFFARGPASAQRLRADALTALEPALASHPGALLHPDDGAVDNVAMMAALDVSVARQPRITRITDEVASFDARGNLPAFRSRGGVRYAAPRLLLANGAWASVMPGLPRALPIRPLHGQLMRLEGRSIAHVTYGAGGYLIPRGASLVVGATSEEVDFDSSTTQRGMEHLRAIATRTIPGLAHERLLEHWAGLRPVSRDGLPILGVEPRLPALCYACGFSRNGILFAPWAAEQLMSMLIDGTKPAALDAFGVERPGLE